MAISDNYVPLRQIGNGATTQFSSNWSVLSASYLQVFFEDAVTGVQTLQTSGYTLVFDGSGFTVTFSVAPTSANYVVIGRSVTDDQTTPFRTSKGFQGDAIESSFDKLTAITQDLHNALARSLKFQVGSTAVGILPAPIDDYIFAWSGTSGLVKNVASGTAILASGTQAAASATAAAASAASASSSQTSATSSASSAAANAAIVSAAAGAIVTITNQWAYSNTTSMADPGTGTFRLNNTIASATQLAVSCLTGDSGNPNLRTYMATWDDSTTTANRGYIKFVKAANPAVFAIFAIGGSLTDNTTWDQIPITYITGSGSFTNGDTIFVQFSRTGDAGASGGGTGDFSSNTSTSVDGEILLFSGTLGKTGKRATGSGFAKVASGVLSSQASINLSDLATQAARTVTANATNSSAVPTAVQLAAATLMGCNAGGTALAAIALGTNVTMSGTTLNVASALPAGTTGSMSSSSTAMTVDFTTYSSYLVEIDGLLDSDNAPYGFGASSDGGSTYGAVDSYNKTGTTGTVGGVATARSDGYSHAVFVIHQYSTSGNVALYSVSGAPGSSSNGKEVSCGISYVTLSAACNKIKFFSQAGTFTAGTFRLTPLTIR